METNAINTMNTYGTSTERTPSPTLDKDGFLKLMMEQLRHQDPSSPQDSGEMLAQMSQLTMVEQITNMTTQETFSRAENLVGRNVTYTAKDGTSLSGTVEQVDISGSTPLLTIGGQPGIDPAALTEVR
jgi:flagellar basal-body rod modification protein FlgD